LTQIIADGGIKSFADVNVALTLGADYVMIGGLFSECIESAGTLLCKSRKGNENEALTVSAYNDENDGKYHFICDTILSQAYYNALVTKYHLDTIKRSDTHYNQFMEKRYEITLTRDQIAIPEVGEWLINTFDLYKLSFGMSSVEAQKERAEMLGKSDSELILKPTEGKSETVKLKTTLKQWTDLCAWYLRDAMSYCNCWNLRDFCSGKVKLVINSQGVKNTVNHF
jgi:IMP dehydrogenase/GMP reductase